MFFTYNLKEGSVSKPKKLGDMSADVVEVEFDLLSTTYALLLLRDGRMFLHDLDQGVNAVSFSKQAVGDWKACFLPKMPGTFVTASDKAGSLLVWNVSQPSPLRSLRLGLPGVRCLCLVDDTSAVLATGTDGAVVIYDVELRRVMWDANAGHTDTVFGAEFSHKDPDLLATCSADRTVRLWSVSELACRGVLTGAEEALHAVAWSRDDAMLAASAASGAVVLYDVRRGAAVKTLRVHSARAMRVLWSPHEGGLLASVADDCRLMVFDSEGKGRADVLHNAAVRGLAWHPHDPDVVATCDDEGAVRVIDVRAVKLQAKGAHPSKAPGFGLAWNALQPALLLSTHSDHSAAVWDLADALAAPRALLAGHTDRVRAALWHPEVPFLCLTGSWDATVRLWDIRTAATLAVFPLHRADVYHVACHPRRPLTLASVSRDSTTRVLSLAPSLAPLVARALLRLPVTASPAAAMAPGAPPALCGPAGLALSEALGGSDANDPREALRRLSPSRLLAALGPVAEALLPPDGSQALVELLLAHLGSGPAASVSHSRRVPYVTHVVDVLNERAQQLELLRTTTKMRGIGAAAKRSELLGQAAHAHLMAGNLGQCCDLMVELGRWEEALALSVLEGPDKYRQVLLQRVADLEEQAAPVDEVAPLLLAAGQHARLIALYVATERYSDAYCLAAMSHAGRLHAAAPLVASSQLLRTHARTHSQPSIGALSRLALGPVAEFDEDRGGRTGDDSGPSPSATPSLRPSAQLVAIQAMQAERFAGKGQRVWAACCLLSVGDVAGAVAQLLSGAQVLLAWAVGRAAGLPGADALQATLGCECALAGDAVLGKELLAATLPTWLLGRLEDAGADAPQMLWLDTASLLAMGVTNAMGAGGKAPPGPGAPAAADADPTSPQSPSALTPELLASMPPWQAATTLGIRASGGATVDGSLADMGRAAAGGDALSASRAACSAVAALLRGAPDASPDAVRSVAAALSSALGLPVDPALQHTAVARVFSPLDPTLRWPNHLAQPASDFSPLPATPASPAPPALDATLAAYGCLLACAGLSCHAHAIHALRDPLMEAAARLLAASSAPPETAALVTLHRLVHAGASAPAQKVAAGARVALRSVEYADEEWLAAVRRLGALHEAGVPQGKAPKAEDGLWWTGCKFLSTAPDTPASPQQVSRPPSRYKASI